MAVPESLASMVQVPAASVVTAPLEALTPHTLGVAEEKTIVPVAAGVEVALTTTPLWPKCTPEGATPKASESGAVATLKLCWTWVAGEKLPLPGSLKSTVQVPGA